MRKLLIILNTMIVVRLILIPALDWILEEIPSEDFKSDAYLNIERLERITRAVQMRTGEVLVGNE